MNNQPRFQIKKQLFKVSSKAENWKEKNFLFQKFSSKMKLLSLKKLKCLTPTCSPLLALHVNRMLADLITSLLSFKAVQNIFMNKSLKFLFSSISEKARKKVHLWNHALKTQVQIFARKKSLKPRNAKKIRFLEKGAEERVVKEVSKMFQVTNPARCKKAQNLQMF